MIEKMLDILLVEDNPADVEMTLDALTENNLPIGLRYCGMARKPLIISLERDNTKTAGCATVQN